MHVKGFYVKGFQRAADTCLYPFYHRGVDYPAQNPSFIFMLNMLNKCDKMVNGRFGKGLAHFFSHSDLAEEEAPYRSCNADCCFSFVSALPYAFLPGSGDMQECSPQSGDNQTGTCIVFHQDF